MFFYLLTLSIETFWEHKDWKSRNCYLLKFLKHVVAMEMATILNVQRPLHLSNYWSQFNQSWQTDALHNPKKHDMETI